VNLDAPRILVVDDEPGMREACQRVLSSNGYEVETAEDGLKALDLCKGPGYFAAALIDLKMPRMDGLELLERMRKLDADIILFVVTAYASLDTAVKAVKGGAYEYIAKPFTPVELLRSVRRGLEMRSLTVEARNLREERESRLLEVAFERSKSNTIIGCMTDGVLVVNRDEQIVLRNPAAANIIPECADMALPAPLAVLQSEQLRGLLCETLRNAAGPFIASKEITLGESTYMVNVSPVIESGESNSGAVAVLRDITAMKKLETLKSTFVSMVVREVKKPLVDIERHLNEAQSDATGHKQNHLRENLKEAMSRAETLASMVSELQDLVSLETGVFQIVRAPLDVAAAVKSAISSCRNLAQLKGIDIVFRPEQDAKPEAVFADGGAIVRVFKYLVDNAIKYTLAGGHVDVRLEYSGVYVKISIQDNGIGISQQEQKRIFEEFYRAKSDYVAAIAGPGLGLALAKKLLQLHQGKVTVQSAPSRGSIFTVFLPLASMADG